MCGYNFYLNDVDEKSGGTWVIHGSHKDKRTPRGPKDNITLTAPISGEMQVDLELDQYSYKTQDFGILHLYIISAIKIGLQL